MEWIEKTSKWSVESVGRSHHSPLYLSNGGGLTREIEALMSRCSSNDTLKVITPIIDDDEIVALLVSLRKRGVIVQCITSLTDSKKGIVTKGWDESQNLQKHHEMIRVLAKSGVLLRSPQTTPHVKAVSRVGIELYFGSANLAKGALRKKSVEVGVVTSDEFLLNGISQAFDHIWQSCVYELVNSSGGIILKNVILKRKSMEKSQFCQWNSSEGLDLFLSRPGKAACLAVALAKLLNRAQKEVIIVALSFYDTDQIPILGDAISACLDRGVRVRVIVRPEHFKTNDYPDPSTKKLIGKGLELLGISGLHAKGVLVDEKWCGMLSANINPYSLDTGCKTVNWEIGLLGDLQNPIFSEWGLAMMRMVNTPTHYWSAPGRSPFQSFSL